MSELHLERVYGWGDNDHYYISVPDDFKLYEIPYISEKQKRYVWFGEYDETLYKAFEKVIGVATYHIEDKLLIVAFNKPLGNIIHTPKHIEKDLTEFNKTFGEWLSSFIITRQVKHKIQYSANPLHLVKKLGEPDLTEERRNEILDELEQWRKKLEQVTMCSVSKIISVNGDKVRTATVNMHDILLRPFDSMSINDEDLGELLADIEFDEHAYSDIFSRLDRDKSKFEEAYASFRKKVEV